MKAIFPGQITIPTQVVDWYQFLETQFEMIVGLYVWNNAEEIYFFNYVLHIYLCTTIR